MAESEMQQVMSESEEPPAAVQERKDSESEPDEQPENQYAAAVLNELKARTKSRRNIVPVGDDDVDIETEITEIISDVNNSNWRTPGVCLCLICNLFTFFNFTITPSLIYRMS